MKNLLSILAFTLAVVAANAQTSATPFVSNGDTVTNTETEYLTLKVTGAYSIVTVQYVASKLSGTVAGNATLQGSLDGTNYVDALVSEHDSVFTNTNVTTQTKIWFVQPGRYLHYRIKCSGSGTMAARVYGYLIAR